MPHKLEAEIHLAWVQAHHLLSSERPNLVEADGVAGDLRKCAERVRAQGLTGERELLWLVERLESLKYGPCDMPYA